MSLAVWMGGACREIAALRSASTKWPEAINGRDAAQREVYRRILNLAGYTSVTVDVIAGTSAGGLNGALFATHLVHGMRFDNGIRDIWLRLGDLESLTRDPGDGAAPSLLKGDDVFYQRLANQLRRLVAQSKDVPAAKSPRLMRLILTATRLLPRAQHIRTSVGPPLLACSSQAHITFRHQRATENDEDAHRIFTDLPAGSTTHLDKLAYAARATSSFPGAFEPARITVAEPEIVDEEPWRNLYGLSSETGIPDAGSTQTQLMDGGVLDNIPLSWAIRAIASAPAGAPVDRWLLYLQPVPPQEPKTPRWAARTGSLAGMFSTLKAFVSTKLDSETLFDDHAELSGAWTAAQRLHGAAGGLPGDPSLDSLPDVTERLARYAESIARTEADRLARLIEDPVSLVGPDPLPIPDCRAFRNGDVQRRVLEQLRGAALKDLALGSRDRDAIVGCKAFRSPLAAARAVALALDWVQAVETTQQLDADMREKVWKIRDELYEARFACEVLLAARDRLLLRGGTQEAVVAWVARASAQLNDLFAQAPTGWISYQNWSVILADVASKAVQPTPRTILSPDWPDRLLMPIWERVAGLCRMFGTALGGAASVPGFRAMSEAALADKDNSPDTTNCMRVLAVAEILLGPLRPDPLAEPSSIQVHAISAAAKSPLETILFTDKVIDDAERVDRKLSGNKLANFASFLSSRWRLNDWTWGRLDAAYSLVEVVMRGARLQDASDQFLVDWLKELYCDMYVSVFGDTSDDLAKHPKLTGLIGPWESLDVTPANVHRVMPVLLTTWLHWNILRQEIPLLLHLESLKSDKDLPPSAADLRNANKTSVSMLSESAGKLGQVSKESMRKLLRKDHLRRAGLRLGLVAWACLTPTIGWKGRFGRTLMALIKPVGVVPPLIGFLAPWWSLGSAALAWGAVAYADQSWYSGPAHWAVGAGATASGGWIAWHFWTNRQGKAVWWRIALAMLLMVGLLTVVVLFGRRWPMPYAELEPLRYLLVGIFACLSVGVSLWGVAGRRINAGKRARRWFVIAASVIPGLVAGGTTYTITLWDRDFGGWWAALVLYLALAVESIMLTKFYPAPPALPADD